MVYQFKVSLYCQHYIVSWSTHEDQLKVVCVQLRATSFYQLRSAYDVMKSCSTKFLQILKTFQKLWSRNANLDELTKLQSD